MTTEEKIVAYQNGIKEIIDYLMDMTKKHLKMKDFEWYVDELPFFPLHCCLKKAVTESLLRESFEKGLLNSESKKVAKNFGFYLRVNGEERYIPFKKMSDFGYTDREPFSYTVMDLGAFHKYIEKMEWIMSYNPLGAVFVHLYKVFANIWTEPVNLDIDAPIDWKDEETWDENFWDEDIEGLAIDWYENSSWGEFMGDVTEDNRPELWDGIIDAFYESRGIIKWIRSSDYKGRKKYVTGRTFRMTDFLDDEQRKYYYEYLDTTIRVLRVKEYGLSEDFILRVVRETYEQMYRFYQAKEVRDKIRENRDIGLREEMLKHYDKSGHSFDNRKEFWGDKSFTNEDIERFNKELGMSIKLKLQLED